MDQSPDEEIRSYARSILARLADLATPEARRAAEHLKAALTVADKAWAHGGRFRQVLDAHAEIEAAHAILRDTGASVLAALEPTAASTYDKETLSAAQETKARSVAMKCAIADLDTARHALVEALTGSGRGDALERIRHAVQAGSDSASEKLETALRTAAQIVGSELIAPPPANDDASARRGRPRKRAAK